jgi:hypothetical protein
MAVSRDYYLKHLRLVPAEAANELGIPAESPVFLSPAVYAPHRCSVCPVTYTPLLYAAGQVTRSQHYHETDGGIYFLVRKEMSFTTGLFHHTGWLAQVEPIGKSALFRGITGRYGIAEAVSCTGIWAWCLCSEPEARQLIRRRHKRHPLDKGLLLGYPFDKGHPGFFLPVCDETDLHPHYAPLRFQIRDGAVYFSQHQ